ncbi:LysR family transcriptional regulator [Pseudomonas sp. LFS044]|uniref:LysR family transcriptional regulator n=1 Tax=Pseudomonas sp. LFS044 TaxID=3229880 RepID=UPI003A7F8453
MSHLRFTTRQLAAFVEVSRVRSFREAGEHLNLSSSAVSQLVADLEAAVGLRLFDRTTRSVSLSPAGREFLPSALSVLKHLQLAQTAVDDISNRAAGVVRIAAPLILASLVLPATIQAYTRDRPKVVIRIRDASVDNLVDMVSNADADLAIGSDYPNQGDVVRTALFKSPWVLWCSPAHPLATGEGLTWAQLREFPLVVAGRDYERTLALTHADSLSTQKIIPVDIVDNISTALGLAAMGDVATLAPAYVGILARKFGLVMRPISKPADTRQVCIYHTNNRAVSPVAEGFRQYLIRRLQDNDRFGLDGIWESSDS